MCTPLNVGGFRLSDADTTYFGRATVYRGSRLADALVRLRELARSGERNKSDVEFEIASLIDNSHSSNH